MSFWVTAYCHHTVAAVTPEDLLLGIADRLETLAVQLPGDRPEEETPKAVAVLLERLKVARDYTLSYPGCPPITTVHFGPDDTPGIIAEEVLPGRLARMRRPEAQRVRELLRGATASVSFSLKVIHHTGIGVPLAVAAAATLVTHAGGVIRSGRSSWMVPAGRAVDIILEYEE